MHTTLTSPVTTEPLREAPRATQRDLRLDFLRGVAAATIVIDHAYLPSLFDYLTRERIGVVSAAEIFVLISGIVVGMVYRRKIDRLGMAEASRLLVDRAWLIYRVCVGLVIAYCAMRWMGIPHMPAPTTPAIVGATPPVVPYRPHGAAKWLADLLMLRFGPARFNVLGMYVQFLLLTPACLLMMRRGRTRMLLALSWCLYAVNFTYRLRATPFCSEVPFPLLSWQLLYVNALAAGYHRQRIEAWMIGRRAILIWCIALIAALALLVFAWHVPSNFIPKRMTLRWIAPATVAQIYQIAFVRAWLGAGRVINAAAVFIVAYGILARTPQQILNPLAWYFIPLGQASLYVFAMHVLVMVAIDNIRPHLGANHLANTALIAGALMIIWVMVRTRFLFRIVPR